MKKETFFSLLAIVFGLFFVVGCKPVKIELPREMKSITSNLEKQLEQNAKLGIRSVEFPEGLDWFNVARPLQMKELKGKVVLLDFWTFCCINCMHVLPELRQLEEKYPQELVVVGIHSAKFINEQNPENIRQSILRYEVKHPVVNDPALLLWRSYGVHAWPTLVLIDPEGRIVFSVSGEGHYDLLDHAVGFLVRQYDPKKLINRTPIPMTLENTRETERLLRFPGKIFADENGLVVSDSNHNQILLIDYSGEVREVIGSGESGSSDGSFRTAQFNHPQGIFRGGGFVYIADTENHLIRQIDLAKKAVRTIAGTGARGGFLHGKASALKIALNSPWDLVKVGSELYIAMAGAHQIWVLNLDRSELDLFVGSGREDIVDGVGSSSALAQPSGLTFDRKEYFYFADSEVSAVRRIHLKTHRVETLIGHGLFDFGDQNGPWRNALLQHPLGVSYFGGALYVADTYNDKIKSIDLNRRTITTLAGTGERKLKDGKSGALYEPGGLSVWAGEIYIADTNNHSIRVLDPAKGELSTLQVKKSGFGQVSQKGEEITQRGADFLIPKLGQKNPFLQALAYAPVTVSENAQISVSPVLPFRHEFTEGTPLNFQVRLREGDKEQILKQGVLSHPEKELPLRFKIEKTNFEQATLAIDLNVSYCTMTPPKLCKFKLLQLNQPLTVSSIGKKELELKPEIQA